MANSISHGNAAAVITINEQISNESTTVTLGTTTTAQKKTTVVVTRTSATTITPAINIVKTSSDNAAPTSTEVSSSSSTFSIPPVPTAPSSSSAPSLSTSSSSAEVTSSTSADPFIPALSANSTTAAAFASSTVLSFSSTLTTSSTSSPSSISTHNDEAVTTGAHRKMSPSAIGGIVILVLALLVLLGLLAFCLVRRKRRSREVRELDTGRSAFSFYDKSLYRDLENADATPMQKARYTMKRAVSSIRHGIVMQAGVVTAGVKSKVGTMRRKTSNFSAGIRTRRQAAAAAPPVASVNMDRGTSQFFESAPVLRSPRAESPSNPFRDPPLINPAANNSTGTLQPGLIRGLMLHLHVPASTSRSSALSEAEAQERAVHSAATSVPSLSAWWAPEEHAASASNYSHSFGDTATSIGVARSFEPPAPLLIRRQQDAAQQAENMSWYEREERERLRWTRLDMERALRFDGS